MPWKNAVVLSLDAATGAVRWKGKRGESRVGHVTPILVDDGAQLVSAGGDRVQGFDARTGKRIWSIYSRGEGVTPSPVVADGLIFTSSGFVDIVTSDFVVPRSWTQNYRETVFGQDIDQAIRQNGRRRMRTL